MVNTRVRRAIHPCSVCGRLFFTVNKAAKHIEKEHPGNIKYLTRGD